MYFNQVFVNYYKFLDKSCKLGSNCKLLVKLQTGYYKKKKNILFFCSALCMIMTQAVMKSRHLEVSDRPDSPKFSTLLCTTLLWLGW